MKEQITRLTCDRCGGVDVPGTQELAVLVRYAAESGGADAFAVADLCPKCMLSLIDDSLSSWATKSKPVIFREELR